MASTPPPPFLAGPDENPITQLLLPSSPPVKIEPKIALKNRWILAYNPLNTPKNTHPPKKSLELILLPAKFDIYIYECIALFHHSNFTPASMIHRPTIAPAHRLIKRLK